MSRSVETLRVHAQEQRLGYILKRAQHALRLYMDKRLESLALSTPQYNVLAAVEQDPGVSNASLARGAFVTAQSMVGTVASLERLGLIQRSSDPEHGRVRMTELTSKGKRILKKAHVALADVEKTMISGLSQDDETAFRAHLWLCTKNLSMNGNLAGSRP